MAWFCQGFQGQLSGQLEQGVLEHLLRGEMNGAGDLVVKAGGGRVQADEKFLHRHTPFK